MAAFTCWVQSEYSAALQVHNRLRETMENKSFVSNWSYYSGCEFFEKYNRLSRQGDVVIDNVSRKSSKTYERLSSRDDESKHTGDLYMESGAVHSSKHVLDSVSKGDPIVRNRCHRDR